MTTDMCNTIRTKRGELPGITGTSMRYVNRLGCIFHSVFMSVPLLKRGKKPFIKGSRERTRRSAGMPNATVSSKYRWISFMTGWNTVWRLNWVRSPFLSDTCLFMQAEIVNSDSTHLADDANVSFINHLGATPFFPRLTQHWEKDSWSYPPTLSHTVVQLNI